jgi:hypothetical protein
MHLWYSAVGANAIRPAVIAERVRERGRERERERGRERGDGGEAMVK